MGRIQVLLVWMVVAGFLLAISPTRLRSAEYRAVTGPCNQHFPKDHGPHSGYKTEWWYYTGNLKGPGDERFGFQLTFFRSRISPNEVDRKDPEPASAWRTRQLYLAHAAVSHLNAGRFYHDEKMSRGAVGIAGADFQGDTVRVFLTHWNLLLGLERHRLQARSEEFAFDLALVPEKPPVLHGRSGYSRKGEKPESASCYYSFTRLAVSGRVSCAGLGVAVTGTAWMDHEYSSAPLEPNLAGWDWFSLQLSDRTELMVYLLRTRQGGYSEASAGSFVDAAGTVTHLGKDQIRMRVLDHWKSPHSGGRYPAQWSLAVPDLGLALTVKPNLADQEMFTPESGLPPYWEGSVSATGSRQDRPVTGSGYVELTGYARIFDAPL